MTLDLDLSASDLALPSPEKVRSELALTADQTKFIDSSRRKIAAILNGEDSRLLLIVGPCSIHDMASAMEYAQKLNDLSKHISDHFFVVMRTYFDKARTTIGWQGYATDPHFCGSEDIEAGIHLTRKLLLNLTDLKIPAAAELLNPISICYFNDLLSWGCVGARTTESQTHRQIASSLPFPIGFKNNTGGNITAAIDGAFTASSAHTYMGLNYTGKLSKIRSSGNKHAHIILRGSESSTNYDPHSIQRAQEQLQQRNLRQNLLIDCSHGNSNRLHENQPQVFKSVIQQIIKGNSGIRGLCVESHLNAGNQPISNDLSQLKYGISITDPCLGWKETEDLIFSSCQMLASKEKT